MPSGDSTDGGRVASIVVLAGGLGRRFGSYKPLYMIGGKPLIGRVVEGAKEISPRVVVSVRNEEQRRKLEGIVDAEFVIDEDLPCFGPVRGILSSAKLLPTLILPADLPWLNGEVAMEFHRRCLEASKGFDVCGLAWMRGPSRDLESTVMIVNSHEPLELVRRACGMKRTRVTDVHRAAGTQVIIGAGMIADAWRLSDMDLPDTEPPSERDWDPEILIYMKEAMRHPYRHLVEALESSDPGEAIRYLETELGIYREIPTLRTHVMRDLKALSARS